MLWVVGVPNSGGFIRVYGGWGGGIGDSEGRNGAGRNFEAVRAM